MEAQHVLLKGWCLNEPRPENARPEIESANKYGY